MNHYDASRFSTHTSIGYLMRRGASLLRNELDRSFERHGFNFIQWATLMLIREDPAVTPADLCRSLHHDSGALTRVLEQLEERGCLRRERGATDRRLVRLHLTVAGRRLVEGLLPTVVDRLNHALADFSAAEVATLTRLLTRLIERLERCEAEPADAAPRSPRS